MSKAVGYLLILVGATIVALTTVSALVRFPETWSALTNGGPAMWVSIFSIIGTIALIALGLKSFKSGQQKIVLGEAQKRFGRTSARALAEGTAIAEDCLASGLRRGRFVKLSDIEQQIAASNSYDADAVSAGFMLRMQEFTKTGEVFHVSTESGDVLFAHRSQAGKLTKLMQGE